MLLFSLISNFSFRAFSEIRKKPGWCWFKCPPQVKRVERGGDSYPKCLEKGSLENILKFKYWLNDWANLPKSGQQRGIFFLEHSFPDRYQERRSFEQRIVAGVSGYKFAPRALFHPKIIRIWAMVRTVNRTRKSIKNVIVKKIIADVCG